MRIDEIIFKIAPRLNAAGRMEIVIDPNSSEAQSGGRVAVSLITAPDQETAINYVTKIDNSNQERKDIDRNITKDAHKNLEQSESALKKKCIVVYDPNWQKGVVGIVASRLVETYYRPAVVLTMSNGFISGSARSILGFDLYQAVEHCADLLENFGGHTYAAGLTMKIENFEKFKAKFEAYAEQNITPEALIPQINIDTPIKLCEITAQFRSDMQRFQPFGPKNPSPTFATYGTSDNNNAKCVGQNEQHLKMELSQKNEAPCMPISAIAFSQIQHFNHIKRGGKIDVCFSLVENHYRGNVKPQLRIKDITPSKL